MSQILAIEGGEPINKKPFPTWPSFSEKTKQEALKPLENGLVNYWTGNKGIEFEKVGGILWLPLWSFYH